MKQRRDLKGIVEHAHAAREKKLNDWRRLDPLTRRRLKGGKGGGKGRNQSSQEFMTSMLASAGGNLDDIRLARTPLSALFQRPLDNFYRILRVTVASMTNLLVEPC